MVPPTRPSIHHPLAHEEVHGALGRDVAERQCLVVLVQDGGGDLLGDDFVEDRGGARVGGTAHHRGLYEM